LGGSVDEGNVEAHANTRYAIGMRAVIFTLVFVAACGGVLAQDDAGPIGDGTIVPPPNKDAGPPYKDSSVVDVFTPDVIAIDATPCTETICKGVCVDTSSDPNNCGGCGNACDSGTCSGGTCAKEEPPVGTCQHSLCKLGGALTEGCDPCTSTLCAADTFCCQKSWDNLCVQDVGQYCVPYSCN